MKKIFSLLILSIMAFSMVACGTSETVEVVDKSEKVEQPKTEDIQETITQKQVGTEKQDETANDDTTKLDEELTQKVSSYMLETWGDPEWGAPWYKNILEIKMFNDDTVRAVLICNINDKSTLDTIAQAVFQYENWIDVVLIHDENGNQLISTTNPFNPDAYKK